LLYVAIVVFSTAYYGGTYYIYSIGKASVKEEGEEEVVVGKVGRSSGGGSTVVASGTPRSSSTSTSSSGSSTPQEEEEEEEDAPLYPQGRQMNDWRCKRQLIEVTTLLQASPIAV